MQRMIHPRDLLIRQLDVEKRPLQTPLIHRPSASDTLHSEYFDACVALYNGCIFSER